MPVPSERHRDQARVLRQERQRQIRGLTFLALAILLLSILRKGVDHVFTRGWWRLW